MRRGLALLVLAAAAAAQGTNLSFENGLEGWEREQGAARGQGLVAMPGVDETIASDGKRSLQSPVDAKAVSWFMVSQTMRCPPFHRVIFTVAGRCRGLRREGNQYGNANPLVLFFDDAGNRLGIVTGPVLHGDRDWVDLTVTAIAPEKTAKMKIGLFNSKSGTAWFDDARVTITHTTPMDRAAREAAFRALKLHLAATYPYFDVRGKTPADLPVDLEAADPFRTAQQMLRPLQDVHIWIRTPFGTFPTAPHNPHAANWNDEDISKHLTKTILDKKPHLAGWIGDIGYLRIGAFQPPGFGDVEKALDQLANARALILDVRPNGGGDERLAQRIAGRFTTKPVVYAKSQNRDPSVAGLDGFFPPTARQLQPLAGARDGRRVVVLQGRWCVSSTEGFLLMMGALDGVETIGLPSRGCSGNPRPFPLFRGADVYLPTWRALTTDGKTFEGAGIPPDVRVPGAHHAEDRTLRKALEILK